LGSAIATHQYHFYAFSLYGDTINLQQGNWQNALGNSSSIGLIFIVEETFNLSSFQVPQAANLWGELLLFDINFIEYSFEEIILAKQFDLMGQPYLAVKKNCIT